MIEACAKAHIVSLVSYATRQATGPILFSTAFLEYAAYTPVVLTPTSRGDHCMSKRRTTLMCYLGVLWFTLLLPQAAAAQCGGTERWPVKVGSDAGASLVDLATPMPTLIHDLVAIPRPQIPSDDVTRVAEERSVRVVDGRLVKFKLE